jgi:YD repeat-containing protein
MTAVSGQVITTITDGNGAVAVQVTWFYDPTTRALRNNPITWTDGNGTVWAVNAGALIAVNNTSKVVRALAYDSQGNVLRQVKLPANSGRAVKAAVLASQPPPDGPFTTADDFVGFTFDLSAGQV